MYIYTYTYRYMWMRLRVVRRHAAAGPPPEYEKEICQDVKTRGWECDRTGS